MICISDDVIVYVHSKKTWMSGGRIISSRTLISKFNFSILHIILHIQCSRQVNVKPFWYKPAAMFYRPTNNETQRHINISAPYHQIKCITHYNIYIIIYITLNIRLMWIIFVGISYMYIAIFGHARDGKPYCNKDDFFLYTTSYKSPDTRIIFALGVYMG